MIGCGAGPVDRGISAIGLRLVFFIMRMEPTSESGEAARDGPLGDAVRDR